MRFQIDKLIIWAKNRTFAPRIVNFKVGAVNVITGGSRSGKSAIIPIIDYCLGSSECHIPIDTIRDCAEWFGVVFEIDGGQLLIARRGPQGRDTSDEFFVSRGGKISIPSFISEANEKTESVKHLLNGISGAPYFRLAGESDPRPYQDRLSFRDLMALIFQSQEIVANQNVLFYKMHAHEHRERLKNWLPYILGAEDVNVLIARQRLSVVQQRLNQLRREVEKAARVSDSWLSNIKGHLQVAKTYGLLSEDYAPSGDSTELVQTVKDILEFRPERPQPTSGQIEQSSRDQLALEQEDDRLSDEISIIRRRLEDIGRLRSGLGGFSNSSKKRADRLHLSLWLEELADGTHSCPLCGAEEHENAKAEITKIAKAFRVVEDEANRTKEIPTSFMREEVALREQLEIALSRRKSIAARIDMALAKDKAAKDQFDRRQNMFFFMGHLQASLETFQSLMPTGKFGEELSRLEAEEKELLLLVDPDGVFRKLQSALKIVAQKALVRLQTLDVEEKYKKVPPQFSVKDLSLKVLSNDGYWHFLAEVGSASNWLSFHIAFICALHEFFQEQEESCVPSFAVFDQPSQVYFPKTTRVAVIDDKSQYADEDVVAVVGIFKTLADSVREQEGKWQCIVLDHARKEIYGEIPEVYEVEVWRDGNKLIPPSWYL